MTLDEAFPILYAARANVARMAQRLDMEPDELKEAFRAYVRERPYDPTAWERM